MFLLEPRKPVFEAENCYQEHSIVTFLSISRVTYLWVLCSACKELQSHVSSTSSGQTGDSS